MKIRKGFISNSSSSSFLMYGVYADADEILECLKATGFIPKDVEDIGEWYWDDGDTKLSAKGLNMESPYEGENVVIGVSWSSIGDDETGKQFKDRIQKIIKEIMGDKFTPNTCSEAWRDG